MLHNSNPIFFRLSKPTKPENRCRKLFRAMGLCAAVTLLYGCYSPPAPSDKKRPDAYAKYENYFTGNPMELKNAVYFLLSGGQHFQATNRIENGTLTWSNGNRGFSVGLAVSLTADGYMLTSAHALNATNFIWGMFEGKMEVKPARVIYKRSPKTHADLALIKVDARLDNWARPAKSKAVPGEPVFAVVCYRKDMKFGVQLTAGRVLQVRRDPEGGEIEMIRSDVPLTHGDSGGPLYSAGGGLIGINSGLSFTLGQHWSDSFLINEELVQNFIEKDRALCERSSR